VAGGQAHQTLGSGRLDRGTQAALPSW